MIHQFISNINQYSIPTSFTYPFDYTPHPLIIEAASQLRTFVESNPELNQHISKGKMLGILLVETTSNPTPNPTTLNHSTSEHPFRDASRSTAMRSIGARTRLEGAQAKRNNVERSAINNNGTLAHAPACASPHSPHYPERQHKTLAHAPACASPHNPHTSPSTHATAACTPQKNIAFIAAFSGLINNTPHILGFVPPVFDYLATDSFFRIGESKVNALSAQIETIESNPQYIENKHHIKSLERDYKAWIIADKLTMKQDKLRRKQLKSDPNFDSANFDNLVRDEQAYKSKHEREKSSRQREIADLRLKIELFDSQIVSLKAERTAISSNVQSQLFEHFNVLNAMGESKSIAQIFRDYNNATPPAGAGDCAAPKLLQYAFSHNLRPLAMGEFWLGASPQSELRRNNEFYPSCMSKCFPILNFMLQGLNVDPKPIRTNNDPQIIFEDEYIIVVNKPAGMLSVPGKIDALSLYDWAIATQPNISGPIIVHRLDMATSGIVILAKNKAAHHAFQRLFESREIHKTYIALLDGTIQSNEGIIDLPICPDINNRPRQMVSQEYGKPSLTTYKVLEIKDNRTLIELHPHTGRTHQLRLHCASPQGLGTPILGDNLYGTPSDRLYLHAQTIEFTHPFTNQPLQITAPPCSKPALCLNTRSELR